MAWESSDRAARLPADWWKIRQVVLKNAGFRCEWRLPSGKRCPRRATEADHKDAKTDDHRPEACQALCEYHHRKKTSREAFAGRRRVVKKRQDERHPLDQR